ncbi:hypothetical protein AB0903_09045 [Streptomyces sp. NPDC048389]|uniref:hypothetical protein n=1 Tax=Streptomyces sp. NPDC048389 TaxID=3154622 RepID=UPI0034563B40
MAGESEPRPPLPTEAQQCRQHTERLLGEGTPGDAAGRQTTALVWAVLAVAAELHDINRKLRKAR